MKRSIGLGTLTLAIGLHAPASAQRLFLHPEAGVQFSTVRSLPLDPGQETKLRTGFVGGLGILYSISPRVTFGTGAYYSSQGVIFSEAGSPEITFKLDYVQVPLTLAVGFPTGGPVTPRVFAGPMVGFKASCKVSASGETLNCDDPNIAVAIKSTDFSLLFGAGIGIAAGPGQITLNGWYDLGLTKIDDSSDQADGKNSFFGFGLGYAFPLGSRGGEM